MDKRSPGWCKKIPATYRSPPDAVRLENSDKIMVFFFVEEIKIMVITNRFLTLGKHEDTD